MTEQEPKQSSFNIGGVAKMQLTLPVDQLHKAVILGMTGSETGRGNAPLRTTVNEDYATVVGYRHNAFLNVGLQSVLDSLYNGLTPRRITHIALSGDNTAVSATTTSIDPSGSGFAPKVTVSVSRTGQTVSAEQTWSNSDVSFSIVKIGLLTGTNATDVVNIIGGSGGSSPYNEPFTIDLTSIATWSLTIGIDVTASAT